MAPARKRVKGSRLSNEEQVLPSVLLADHRTAWVVKNDDQAVELKTKGETFVVSKAVLTKHSEYFESCLNGQFQEASKRTVQFDDDVDPRYLALYIGVAYSHSSIVPHTPPLPAENPEASYPKTPLRDFIEVYKLCDRFLSPAMANFMAECINASIGDGHRALHRAGSDIGMQKTLTRNFADGYEVLEMAHCEQADIGIRLINYFCEGVSYVAWEEGMEDVMDRPKFVAAVSREFAAKLGELQAAKKLKRKELKGP